MSAKQKAVEDIRKFAKMFSGFLELAEDLEGLASVDHAIEESKMRLEIAKKAEVEALAMQVKAENDLAMIASKASEIESAANASASAMMDDVRLEIAKMKSDAEMQLVQINKVCEETKAESEMRVKEAGASLVEIVMKKAETQKALDELTAQLKELRARLVL